MCGDWGLQSLSIDPRLLIPLSLVIVLLMAILIMVAGIKVLKEWERFAVLRLGKFYRIIGPGIVYVVPILDKTIKISLRDQNFPVDTGNYVASDGHTSRITGTIVWRGINVQKAVLSVEDHIQALWVLFPQEIRKLAQSMPSDTIGTDEDGFKIQLLAALDPMLERWGVEIEEINLRSER